MYTVLCAEKKGAVWHRRCVWVTNTEHGFLGRALGSKHQPGMFSELTHSTILPSCADGVAFARGQQRAGEFCAQVTLFFFFF